MMRLLKFFTPVALFLLQPLLSNADSVENLNFDPFRKPDFAIPSRGKSKSLTSPNLAWSPKLRATMVAGKNSMANVDGTIIKVGEEIQGYKLLEVRMRTAIFVKDGNPIELTLETDTSRS